MYALKLSGMQKSLEFDSELFNFNEFIELKI